jgi:hypothetical protein
MAGEQKKQPRRQKKSKQEEAKTPEKAVILVHLGINKALV